MLAKHPAGIELATKLAKHKIEGMLLVFVDLVNVLANTDRPNTHRTDPVVHSDSAIDSGSATYSSMVNQQETSAASAIRALSEREVYYPGSEDLEPDEMRVVACGTGMPSARPKQAAASFLEELGNGDKF